MRAIELIQKAKSEGLSVRPTSQGIIIRNRGVAFVVNPDDTAERVGTQTSPRVSISAAASALNIA